MTELTSPHQNRLARRIQERVPLVPRPFAALANELGLREGQVIDQLSTWRETGRLREISAVLEGSAFGHDSALVTARVPEARIDEVAAVVNAHPTVSHNYRRDHAYNLWFTISVPPHQPLEWTLRILAGLTGIEAYHPLRRTMTFKVGVNFDLASRKNATAPPEPGTAPPRAWPAPRQQRMYRLLQTPLSLSERPFAALVAGSRIRERDLLDFGRRQLGGRIRRYVATFHHRRIGVRGNAMAVWRVAEESLARIGRSFCRFPEVSHCYARNTIPGFPFNLYSMLHGPDRRAVVEIADRLASAHELTDYRLLFSTHEYKKCRLRYFQPELEAWWERHSDACAPSRSEAASA